MLLICFLSVQQIYAQDEIKIDSLQAKLTNSKEDTTKVKVLLDLSDIYNSINQITALSFANRALDISGNIKNETYLVRSHIAIGNSLLFIGNYDDAANHFLISLKISQKNKFESEELVALTHLGLVQDRIQKFDNALKYFFEALNIYNSCKEQGRPLKKVKNIHSLYNNIGNIYSAKNDFRIAEEYYLKGLTLAEQQSDNINVGAICNNLGNLEMNRSNYSKAYVYLIKSLEARTKINDKSGMAKSYLSISAYYQKINQLDQALDYSKKALLLGNEVKERLIIQTATMYLYELYKKQGNLDRALVNLEKFKQVSDSLINDNKIEAITRLQLQYEYDNIETEREAKQQVVRYTYITILSSLVLGLVILGLLFFLAKSRNKATQLEKEKLEKDVLARNKELTTNALYLLKKNELIDNITSRLLKLKEKLKVENVEPLQKIIHDLQSITEKEVWEEFEYRFQNVHEEFYKNLKKKFPDLTPAEIKLAAFLRLNMTTKDIASITGQSVNTLETARYRLRKKLGIANQEVNLVNFLLDF